MQVGDIVGWNYNTAGDLIYNGKGPWRIIRIQPFPTRCNCSSLARSSSDPRRHQSFCQFALNRFGIKQVTIERVGSYIRVRCRSSQIQKA
jgi:hypothetical protein